MIKKGSYPIIVVAGHPNEGKSSILATLVEDDSVKISPYPGETKHARHFPVIVDNKEIIGFVDTPGFQNPMRILAWIKKRKDEDSKAVIKSFISQFENHEEYREDCELLKALIEADVVLFVVDASRPIRRVDKAEMEFLRLLGRPRVAILNCKNENDSFIEQWRGELRRYFNSVMLFNAYNADFNARIQLLESIKGIDYELTPQITEVIQAIKKDWEARCEQAAIYITEMIKDILSFKSKKSFHDKLSEKEEQKIKKDLLEKYKRFAVSKEEKTFRQLRLLYKHNVLKTELPAPPILEENLFSEKNWKMLGLTRKQFLATGFTIGAYTGAMLDLGHGGLSLGLYSLLGGMIGGVSAYAASNSLLSGQKIMGFKLEKYSLTLGPAANIQLLYILIDRALIYYRHLITWPHGKRDYPKDSKLEQELQKSFVRSWSKQQRKIAEKFFQSVIDPQYKPHKKGKIEEKFTNLIKKCLLDITNSNYRALTSCQL